MPTRAATYFDANASAPLHPKAAQALHELLDLGLIPNPSSIHSHGRRAKRHAAEARERVALSLGAADAEQLIFTSSGTEANQLAVRSVLEPRLLRGERPHWVTTAVEHDSVLQLIPWLEARGGTVTRLGVDAQGRLDLSQLEAAWRPETALVSAVWVNNETGVVTDVERLSQAVAGRDGILHLDAAQAWGKLPLDVENSGAHLIAVSAHKIGGLAGAGALWVRRGMPASAMILGKQEKGRRGGTENLAGIVAMAAAAAAIDPAGWASRLGPARDALESAVRARISGTFVHGNLAPRVANTSNLGFDGLAGEGLVMALDLEGYSVSAGSACSSGAIEPSHVLMAMGCPRERAQSAVRVSLHEAIGASQIDDFVEALSRAVTRVRGAGA